MANYPKDDEAAMVAWVTDLSRTGVTPGELERFVEKWAQHERFMPVPSDILGPILKARKESDYGLVILDPVKTGESCGVAEIGSRSVCEAKGLEYQELRDPPTGELATPGQRKALLARIESLTPRTVEGS